MEMLIGLAFIITLLFGVFAIPAGMLASKAYRATKGEKPDGIRAIYCYLPMYNIIYARKQLYGASPVFTIGAVIIALLSMFRMVSLVFLTAVPVLTVYSSMGMLLAIALFYIMCIIHAVDICRMIDGGVLTLALSVVVPPLAMYILSLKMLPYFRDVKEDLDDTFAAQN